MSQADTSSYTRPIRWRPWVAFSRWVVLTPVLMWLLVAVLLGSAVAGYIFWYGNSILAAPWYLWLFVPDSPLSVTLMAFALLVYHFGRSCDVLGLISVGACIKYGAWTDYVWLTNYLSGGRYHFTAILMSATHFGMIVLGLILATFLRFRPVPVIIAVLFFIVNDIVDYAFGYHPPLPNPEDIQAISRFSIATTAVVTVFFLAMAWLSWRRSMNAQAALDNRSMG